MFDKKKKKVGVRLEESTNEPKGGKQIPETSG